MLAGPRTLAVKQEKGRLASYPPRALFKRLHPALERGVVGIDGLQPLRNAASASSRFRMAQVGLPARPAQPSAFLGSVVVDILLGAEPPPRSSGCAGGSIRARAAPWRWPDRS